MADDELRDLVVLAGRAEDLLKVVEFTTLLVSTTSSSSSLNAGLPGGPYCWVLGLLDLKQQKDLRKIIKLQISIVKLDRYVILNNSR